MGVIKLRHISQLRDVLSKAFQLRGVIVGIYHLKIVAPQIGPKFGLWLHDLMWRVVPGAADLVIVQFRGGQLIGVVRDDGSLRFQDVFDWTVITVGP